MPVIDGRVLAQLQRRFNITITPQRFVDTPDGQGGTTRVWSSDPDLPAAIEELSAQEKLAQAQVQVTVSHRILVAYRTDWNARMRILYGGRTFWIHSVVDHGEQHILTEALVEERA